MLHIYYGDGKGKTTAATGAAIRAAGAGWKVIFARFQKSRNSSELKILENIENITLLTPVGDYPFYRDMTQFQKEALRAEHGEIFETLSDMAFHSDESKLLIVCDELLHAIKYKLVDVDEMVDYIIDSNAEIIVTGRKITDDRLKAHARYITEMRAIRHPYEEGVAAREGVEF